MTLKNFLDWIKYSGVWVGVVLNPYHWEPDVKFYTKTEYDVYGLCYLEINLGLIWIRIIIDDGRW